MYIDFFIIYFLLYCLIYLQRVHMVSLEKTVPGNVIQDVKTVIFLMVCVILDVIRAGRETFVTKVIIMFKYTFYFFFWIYMKNEFKKHRPLYYRTFSKLSTWLFWGRKPIQNWWGPLAYTLLVFLSCRHINTFKCFQVSNCKDSRCETCAYIHSERTITFIN